eukprot:1146849-Pelagomonas_calceolata.AAC.7
MFQAPCFAYAALDSYSNPSLSCHVQLTRNNKVMLNDTSITSQQRPSNAMSALDRCLGYELNFKIKILRAPEERQQLLRGKEAPELY